MFTTRRVEVVDYDPHWVVTFGELKVVLEARLGELSQRIEHVGSTSIPGLVAKPVIDLDIIIESSALLPDVIVRLAELGYTHVGDLDVPGREAFRREGEDVPNDNTGKRWPRHNLYVCPQDGPGVVEHLDFRDYLRAHPEEILVYEALKRRLAQTFPDDLDAYTEGKAAYIQGVLRGAKAHSHGLIIPDVSQSATE
jgi:GrpB-like predicted nucleotidyltransferase (UPF0157 family)